MGHWQYCLNKLEEELSAQNFSTWIRPLQSVEEQGVIRLLAPNLFVLDWVRAHYMDKIAHIAEHLWGTDAPSIQLEIGSVSTPALHAANRAKPAEEQISKISNNLNPAFNFDSFVEGKSNQLARAASFQIAENPGTVYNPLFIYGGVGLGKTHLMHAIGNLILTRNPQARVLYLHSESFVAEMVRALQHNKIDDFKHKYRTLNALLIDDVQFFAGKDRSQEEFFHTFNALFE
jgi:chromosomal replication initiator protein